MAHIRIDFLHRREYHGLGRNDDPDWPPSPLRLLGALIAGAHTLESDDERRSVLGAVERLTFRAAPVIHAPGHLHLRHPRTYTEKTAPGTAGATAGVLDKFLDLTVVGMSTSSRTAKPVHGVLLEAPTIRFDVGAMSDEDASLLQRAADAIGYFGRSQDHAIVTVSTSDPEALPGEVVYEPHPDPLGRQRGWTPESVSWFEARHHAIMLDPGRPLPAEVGVFTRLRYDRRSSSNPTAPPDTSRDPLTPVMFTRGIRLSDVPRQLRLVGALPEGVRAIPLVNFNRPGAKCYGFAVSGALQPRLTAAALIRDRIGPLASEEVGVESPLFHRYTDMAAGRRWITATPIRAFGHPRMLERALTSVLPTGAIDVEASTRPLDAWQQRFPDLDLTDGLSQWFVRFTTPEAIDGPLSIGARTDLGFGLCVPVHTGGSR
ncbi:MAG: type I-U CRISPR-associated protein Csb2 [Gordonia sp. (in: high G+C Gram-positive bacteria)]|uniref:type I-G CRISPR-associated protein Csb2 n=1 Tax=Gordonia sp. (in: high G+C Gram-positive bacteria) TaxID=84139 RepID=UPI0039E4B3C3